jgi:hypothetical protein
MFYLGMVMLVVGHYTMNEPYFFKQILLEK